VKLFLATASTTGRVVDRNFFLCLYSPLGPCRLTYRRFLELFIHMVGLLGRVISSSQGLYLHRTTQHRKTRDKHPCLERDSNPRSQQPTGQDPSLRLHGHRLIETLPKLKTSTVLVLATTGAVNICSIEEFASFLIIRRTIILCLQMPY
jgi:hypothetical protein